MFLGPWPGSVPPKSLLRVQPQWSAVNRSVRRRGSLLKLTHYYMEFVTVNQGSTLYFMILVHGHLPFGFLLDLKQQKALTKSQAEVTP